MEIAPEKDRADGGDLSGERGAKVITKKEEVVRARVVAPRKEAVRETTRLRPRPTRAARP